MHLFGYLHKENCCAVATSGKKKCFASRKNRDLALHSGSLYIKVQRPRSKSLPNFDIENIWQIRSEKSFSSARRLLPADMLERWPHVCCVKITFTLLLTDCFVSTATNSMKCVVNWIPLRISVRSRNKQQPHLNIHENSENCDHCGKWYLIFGFKSYIDFILDS